MAKKFLSLFLLINFMNFLICCSNTESLSGGKIIQTPPSSGAATNAELRAQSLPEIQLSTQQGNAYKGKILSLKGETLILLPFPYWNVEPVELDLEDIHSIQLPKRGSRAAKNALIAFGSTFIISGTIFAGSSKYDEDYEEALLWSASLGGLGGMVGLVIGGLVDVFSKSGYDFYKMNKLDKMKAIKKIMGLAP